MILKDELRELAERVEAATGPDRDLDVAVAVAIDWREPDWEEGERTAREMADKHGLPWLVSRSVEGYNSTWRHLPRFTASLDAAMQLVPEGWVFSVSTHQQGAFAVLVDPKVGKPVTSAVSVATPALALTAAALPARASIKGSSDADQ